MAYTTMSLLKALFSSCRFSGRNHSSTVMTIMTSLLKLLRYLSIYFSTLVGNFFFHRQLCLIDFIYNKKRNSLRFWGQMSWMRIWTNINWFLIHNLKHLLEGLSFYFIDLFQASKQLYILFFFKPNGYDKWQSLIL